MHLNSSLLFQKYASKIITENSKVLEIGPSSAPSPFQLIVNNNKVIWETIDFVDTKYIDIDAAKTLTYSLNSSYDFPFPDNTYDYILSGQVLEHVEKIWLWIKELKRILKPGGKIITINPVSWPYHEAPIDCWRVYPSGIKALAEEAGLEIDLCLFESLETELILDLDPKSTFIPGKSYKYLVSPKKLSTILIWNKFIRRVPRFKHYLEIPIEVAYDTISILSKI